MAGERQAGLSAVLDAIRRDDGVTQTTLIERVGLGRSVVAERVTQLQEAGLILSTGRGPSTGGRAPRRLSLSAGVATPPADHAVAAGAGSASRAAPRRSAVVGHRPGDGARGVR